MNTGSSTSYTLIASAPSDIKAGHTYSVYVSNGYNGNGSSGGETVAAGTLLGRSGGSDYWNLGVPWAADLNYTSNVYNVQTDPRLLLHANGSGSAGDFAAINGAIYIASLAGGGIVYLPAGTYNLYFSNGCGITLLPRVSVVGAGLQNTTVNYGYGAPPSNGGYAACFGTTQAGISDITFNNVNQSGKWPQSGAGLAGNEIFLQRTAWNIGTAQWLVIQNSTNLTVQNTTITQGLDPTYNGPLSLNGSTNFVLRGNTIKYVAGALVFDLTNNGVFENNTVLRDASQSAPSSVISHVLVGNFAHNLMLLGNNFNVTGGTLPLRNDGETIGSESGGSQRYDEFRGTVDSAGSNWIYDGAQNFNYSSNNVVPNLRVGAILSIVAGQGAGQWAVVTSVSSDGHTVVVNQPWAVLPTSGSTYATFDWGAANWIIAGNTLANNEKGIEFFDASIRDILITGNNLTNNGEILISPTEQPLGAGLFNLVVNTQILNNTVTDNNGLRPAAISAVAREDQQFSNFGTSLIGLEIRGNTITGTTPNTTLSDTSLDDSKALSEGINLYWQWQTIANFVDTGIPSTLATIVQGNTFNNSSTAYNLNTGDYQTVLIANTTNNVGRLLSDIMLPGATHASVDTSMPVPGASIITNPPAPTPPAPTTPILAAASPVSEVSVFSSTGLWTTTPVSGSATSISFLAHGTIPVPGDYDGDGIVDCADYSSGNFYIRPSSNPNAPYPIYFGVSTDIPMPADYDGDGKTDAAVFRPSTGQWFYAPSSQPGSPNVVVQTQALSSDIPLLGDYDGDGKTDFTFFRPSTGTFFQMFSSNLGVTYRSPFSLPTDLPVPGDYDGDGMTDLAVYRPSTGEWFYRPSSNEGIVVNQSSGGGQAGDIPVPGDYDGDGKTDFAVWRPATQTWYINFSSNAGVTVAIPVAGLSGSITPLSVSPNAPAAKASLTK